jgi:hypothetical protein
VLSEALGREIAVGQIIHGEDHTTLEVKTSAIAAGSFNTNCPDIWLVRNPFKEGTPANSDLAARTFQHCFV